MTNQQTCTLKWIVATCAIGIAFFYSYTFGYFDAMYQMDASYVSLATVLIFIITHFAILAYIRFPKKNFENRLWFITETLISIGLVGTIIGFLLLFGDAFDNIDPSNVNNLKSVLADLASGMSTALITTLTGLVSSIVLKFELMFVAKR